VGDCRVVGWVVGRLGGAIGGPHLPRMPNEVKDLGAGKSNNVATPGDAYLMLVLHMPTIQGHMLEAAYPNPPKPKNHPPNHSTIHAHFAKICH